LLNPGVNPSSFRSKLNRRLQKLMTKRTVRGGITPLALAGALLLGSGSLVVAPRVAGHFADKIGLSQTQRDELKKLHEETRAEIKQMREEGRDRSEIRQRIADARQRGREILTPEQRAQIESLRAEGRARHEQAMQQRLGLSDEQMSRIRAAREELRARMETLRGNTSLTDEQRRAQARQLAEEARNTFRGILTEEQRRQIEEMRAQRREHRLQRPRREGAQDRTPNRPSSPTSRTSA
jgi:periplasmic protein CpxP/Spy